MGGMMQMMKGGGMPECQGWVEMVFANRPEATHLAVAKRKRKGKAHGVGAFLDKSLIMGF